MERYFYITYAYDNGFGHFSCKSVDYPNLAYLTKWLYENQNVKAVIINILEMTEKDYISFNS